MRPVAPGADAGGYVELRTHPYRGHALLAERVLKLTRPGDRIFEGGVSTGYFAEVLTREGRVVDGAELDPVAAEQARRVCETVIVGDLQELSLDELAPSYKALVFGDTLEHLPRPEEVLRRLRERLDDDGHAIISIPNIANWAIRLSLLFGRFKYTDRGILDRTHLRFFTAKTVRQLFETAGFDVLEVVGAIPVPFVRSPRLGLLFHRIGNLRPSVFAYTFIVTATPKPDHR